MYELGMFAAFYESSFVRILSMWQRFSGAYELDTRIFEFCIEILTRKGMKNLSAIFILLYFTRLSFDWIELNSAIHISTKNATSDSHLVKISIVDYLN